MGRIDQEIQRALRKRVVLQHPPDRADLQAEVLEARGVDLASCGLLQDLDKTVDFGVARAERDLLQKLGGDCQKGPGHNVPPGRHCRFSQRTRFSKSGLGERLARPSDGGNSPAYLSGSPPAESSPRWPPTAQTRPRSFRSWRPGYD